MKKWLSLLFVACFIARIAIILTADTGIMGNYGELFLLQSCRNAYCSLFWNLLNYVLL